MKEVKLHTLEAKRSRANTLFTRFLACCKTTTAKAAYVKKLMSGMTAHIFIVRFFSDTRCD